MIGGLGSMLDLMLGSSSFENPGLMMTKPHQIMSLVKSDNSEVASYDSGFISADDYFYNDSMLELLHSWELTQSILGVISSTLIDILSGAEPLISTGDNNLDSEVNAFLKNIGLTQNIIENLDDDLYYGQRAFWVDIESKTLVGVKDCRNFIMVKHLGTPYKFQFNNKEIEDKEVLLEYNKLGYISFKAKKIKSKKSEKLNLTKDKRINSIIEDLEYYKGESVLKSVLYIIFNHFLKSLLSQLLTLKNTLRPDLIQANISNSASPEFNIADAVSNIESLLNNGEYAFDMRSTNSYAMIGALYNQMMNSVKVVPGLGNYTNIDVIQQPDLTAKIDNLNREIQEAKTNALNNMGIPEELFGGSSNRWEVISRNARFFSFIKDLLNSISNTYKHIAKNYIEYKYPKSNITADDIDLNIDTNNYLTSTASTSRLEVLAGNIQRLTDTLSAIANFSDMQLLNKQEAIKHIQNVLSSTDSSLSKLINFNNQGPNSPQMQNMMGSGDIQTQSGNNMGGW